MKKIHKKIAFSKARYIDKIVGDIKSIKRTRSLKRYSDNPKSRKLTYSRKTRCGVMQDNGIHYVPTNIKAAIAGFSDLQKAKLLRAFYKEERRETTRKNDGQRQYRIYGNFYNVKATLCWLLFKK